MLVLFYSDKCSGGWIGLCRGDVRLVDVPAVYVWTRNHERVVSVSSGAPAKHREPVRSGTENRLDVRDTFVIISVRIN